MVVCGLVYFLLPPTLSWYSVTVTSSMNTFADDKVAGKMPREMICIMKVTANMEQSALKLLGKEISLVSIPRLHNSKTALISMTSKIISCWGAYAKCLGHRYRKTHNFLGHLKGRYWNSFADEQQQVRWVRANITENTQYVLKKGINKKGEYPPTEDR